MLKGLVGVLCRICNHWGSKSVAYQTIVLEFGHLLLLGRYSKFIRSHLKTNSLNRMMLQTMCRYSNNFPTCVFDLLASWSLCVIRLKFGQHITRPTQVILQPWWAGFDQLKFVVAANRPFSVRYSEKVAGVWWSWHLAEMPTSLT